MTAPRGRGRPAVGERVEVRLPAELLKRIDQQAYEWDMPRAAALRRLLEMVDELDAPPDTSMGGGPLSDVPE